MGTYVLNQPRQDEKKNHAYEYEEPAAASSSYQVNRCVQTEEKQRQPSMVECRSPFPFLSICNEPSGKEYG